MSFAHLFHKNILYVLLALIIGWALTDNKINAPVSFKIGLTVETDAKNQTLQFYCHSNKVYTGKTRVENSYSAENQISPGVYRIVNNIKCGDTATNLRFDPLPSVGVVSIASMRIHTSYWHQIDLEDAINHIRPINSIKNIALDEGKITITSIGNDPYIELSDNLQSYLTTQPRDYLWFLIKYSLMAFLLIKILTIIMYKVLINGKNIVSTGQNFKHGFDRRISQLWSFTHNYLFQTITISGLLLLTAVLMYLFSTHVFAMHISRVADSSYVLTFSFTALQFALVFCLYLCLLRLVHRIMWLRVLLGFGLLFCCLWIAADVSLFSLNGMHAKHGLGMLVDGGISQFFSNLKFTGLSSTELTLYVILLFAGIALSIAGVWLFENKLKRSHLKLSAIHLLLFTALTVMFIYGLQQSATKHLNKQQISTFELHHPIGLSFFDFKDHVISFNAQAKPFERLDTAPTAIKGQAVTEIDNIYLFIFESLRADVVNPEVTPNLVSFKDQAWHFIQGVASGNATHYGWYSIVNAKQPFYWERYTKLRDKQGSVPLQLFKQLGYRINIYSAKDLSYLQSDQTMFGQNLSLIDYISPHPKMSPPEHDRRTMDELLEDIKTKHQHTKNFNIIFLDSSHYPYRWNSAEIDEIHPFQGTPAEGTDLSHAKRIIKNDKEPIFNRYKNSIKYMDHLFGEMNDAIEAKNLSEKSMVVAVGDHGQQFMEHGYMLHGFTLYNEDIKVPLYFKAPKINFGMTQQVAAHVDIMPTLLDYIGVDTSTIKHIEGQSLLADIPADFKLTSVAGEQNTPSVFVLSSPQWKLYFRTERNNPSAFKNIYVTEITDQHDQVYVPGKGLEQDYLTFIKQEFPNFIQHTSIFK